MEPFSIPPVLGEATYSEIEDSPNMLECCRYSPALRILFVIWIDQANMSRNSAVVEPSWVCCWLNMMQLNRTEIV